VGNCKSSSLSKQLNEQCAKEIKYYSGNKSKCRFACPDCGSPTRITKTVRLKTTGGRRLKLKCSDQKHCLWSGQLWEGKIPGMDWRKRKACNSTKTRAEIVLKIRAEYKSRKVTYDFLARKYSFSKSQIRRIITREHWSHI
jgi:hypothetical protein